MIRWLVAASLLLGCGPVAESDPVEGSVTSLGATSEVPGEDHDHAREPRDSDDANARGAGAADEPGALQAACFRGDTEACDQLGH